MSKYQWNVHDLTVDRTVEQIANTEHLKPGIAAMLVQRGIKTTKTAIPFLKPTLRQLRDPFLLNDMQKAVDRIYAAIDKQEQITIYGDYDADGITSTTIMYETLSLLGAKVNYYLPNRFIDGYGPNVKRYRQLIDAGTQVMITVDNGITGVESIKLANSLGVDVIVTDHHQRGPQLPDAYATVYARYPGHEYPFDDFCGAGIAFKVSCALLKTVPMELMGLAAIGTIADLVSVTDENRVIVSLGLQQLQRSDRPGLKQLLSNIGLTDRAITEEDIGFQIAPRFNALGRLGDAQTGIQTLTAIDSETSIDLANLMELQNVKRQLLVKKVAQVALLQADKKVKAGLHALVIAGDNWHAGIVGIVASQIVETYDCPVIVLSHNPKTHDYKGSGRSIEGFNLFEALDDNRDHMQSFGGHAMACGLSVSEDQLDHLQQHFEQAYLKQTHGQSLVSKLEVATVITPKVLTMDFYHEIQQLAPFGTNNEKPHFEIDHVDVKDVQRIGSDQMTLKFKIVDGDKQIDVIGFKMGQFADEIQQATDLSLVVDLSLNIWKGKTSLQLMLKDFATN